MIEACSESHLSEYQLASLVLQDGLGDHAPHLQECERCAAVLSERRSENSHFRQHVVPRTIGDVEKTLSRNRSWRWTWVALPVLAAAVLLLVLGSRPEKSPQQGERIIATKGAGASFYVVGKRGESVFRVTPESEMHPGDSIRFVVSPVGYSYLLLLSLDGLQTVSLYHPYAGAESAPIAAEASLELPNSIILDDALGVEYLFGVFSKTALTASEVIELMELYKTNPKNISNAIVSQFSSERSAAMVAEFEMRKVAP